MNPIYPEKDGGRREPAVIAYAVSARPPFQVEIEPGQCIRIELDGKTDLLADVYLSKRTVGRGHTERIYTVNIHRVQPVSWWRRLLEWVRR